MSKGVPFAYRWAAKTVTKRWFLTSLAREQACSAVITNDGTGSTDCQTVQSKIHFVLESVWEVRIELCQKIINMPCSWIARWRGVLASHGSDNAAKHLPQPLLQQPEHSPLSTFSEATSLEQRVKLVYEAKKKKSCLIIITHQRDMLVDSINRRLSICSLWPVATFSSLFFPHN